MQIFVYMYNDNFVIRFLLFYSTMKNLERQTTTIHEDKLQRSKSICMEQTRVCFGKLHQDNQPLCQVFWQPIGGICRAPWLRGRASDFRLREPGFESCATVLKPWASFFTLHCSSSLSCINEYLVIDSGGYVYEQPSRIHCSIWLNASQRSPDGV